jgi:hypothetical protein
MHLAPIRTLTSELPLQKSSPLTTIENRKGLSPERVSVHYIHRINGLYMSTSGDRLTSIPVHSSTVKLLQQLKTGAQNWDEFLLSAFEDLLPPETIAELERREREEPSRSFAEVSKDHPRRARRQRVGRGP